MKIAIVSTQATHGGAARASMRLHTGMLEKKIDSVYLVKYGGKELPSTKQLKVDKLDDIIERVVQKFYINPNRSSLTDTYFSFNYTNVNSSNNRPILEADIINLHWIDKFIGDKSLKYMVENNKPIVWTLHDEKPYTGGCHYTAGCTNFQENCDNCPQMEETMFSVASKALESKIEILRNANLTIVTPSQWLAKEARKSSLFKNCRVECIPNSIELDIFKPYNKQDVKNELGMPSDSITIMFGAHDNKSKRKGFSYLLDAMKLCLNDNNFMSMCNDKKLNIVTVGIPNSDISALPIDVYDFGFIDDDIKMAKIYSATNLFILPSLEDNLPNTMLEAYACETMVIGFDTGGIPDVVKDNINGYVVEKADSKALSESILKAINNPDIMTKFGQVGRNLINEKFKLSDQTNSYLNLFNDILDNRNEKKKHHN